MLYPVRPTASPLAKPADVGHSALLSRDRTADVTVIILGVYCVVCIRIQGTESGQVEYYYNKYSVQVPALSPEPGVTSTGPHRPRRACPITRFRTHRPGRIWFRVSPPFFPLSSAARGGRLLATALVRSCPWNRIAALWTLHSALCTPSIQSRLRCSDQDRVYLVRTFFRFLCTSWLCSDDGTIFD